MGGTYDVILTGLVVLSEIFDESGPEILIRIRDEPVELRDYECVDLIPSLLDDFMENLRFQVGKHRTLDEREHLMFDEPAPIYIVPGFLFELPEHP